MKLSPKQLVGQKILAEHMTLKVENLTLMYTPASIADGVKKPCIIVSVSKKISPKAVTRNYNKRVLRSILRETLPKEKLVSYNWMWICKVPLISKDLRLKTKDALAKLTS